MVTTYTSPFHLLPIAVYLICTYFLDTCFSMHQISVNVLDSLIGRQVLVESTILLCLHYWPPNSLIYSLYFVFSIQLIHFIYLSSLKLVNIIYNLVWSLVNILICVTSAYFTCILCLMLNYLIIWTMENCLKHLP